MFITKIFLLHNNFSMPSFIRHKPILKVTDKEKVNLAKKEETKDNENVENEEVENIAVPQYKSKGRKRRKK